MNWLKRLYGAGFILHIHMKSGKTIKVDGIKNYTINYTGNEITGLKLEYAYTAKRRLIVQSLALDQVEAIERED